MRRLDGRRVISYGTSSYGYDVRCAAEFKVFTNINSAVVDPKGFDDSSFVDKTGEICIVPPNSFALARTVEYFRIPRGRVDHLPGQVDLRTLRHHRQRYAAGAGVGRACDAGVLQYHALARQDLCQRRRRRPMIFFQADEVCETSYRDRDGKYQGQTGVTLPKGSPASNRRSNRRHRGASRRSLRAGASARGRASREVTRASAPLEVESRACFAVALTLDPNRRAVQVRRQPDQGPARRTLPLLDQFSGLEAARRCFQRFLPAACKSWTSGPSLSSRVTCPVVKSSPRSISATWRLPRSRMPGTSGVSTLSPLAAMVAWPCSQSNSTEKLSRPRRVPSRSEYARVECVRSPEQIGSILPLAPVRSACTSP